MGVLTLPSGDNKYTKYVNDYSKLHHVNNKPFIIAVAPFEQPFFFEQADAAIRRVLYKYNTPLYIKNGDDAIVIGEEFVDTVTKHTGSEIELGFFTDDRMKEVSAIIFSNTATMTKVKAMRSSSHQNTIFFATRYRKGSWDNPYHIVAKSGEFKETHLDGLHIFLNPFAENTFDPDIFYSDDIALHILDTSTSIPETYLNDGFLISHGCFTGVKKGEIDKSLIHKAQDKTWKDYSFKWDDDTLYPINATVGLGINNHLAHYQGWTVVVYQDTIDKDWGCFAKNVITYSIQGFISAPSQCDMVSAPDFYPTKEEAYASIKKVLEDKKTSELSTG